MGKFKYYV